MTYYIKTYKIPKTTVTSPLTLHLRGGRYYRVLVSDMR